MITSLSDVLWYWDAMTGLDPIIGGDAMFTRDSSGLIVPDRGFRIRPVAADYPRPTWVTIDDDRVPVLSLEAGGTNELSDSNDFSGTSDWTVAPGLTTTAIPSIFQGQSAYLTDNDGTFGSRSFSRIAGTLTGGPESLSVIWEDIDAEQVHFGIADTSGGLTWVALARWTPGGGLVIQAGSGTLHGPVDLGNGRMWMGVTGSGTVSNARSIYVYPTGTQKAVRSAIVHFAQHEESGWPSSPIITTTSAASRAAEALYWDGAPRPQAMVIYQDMFLAEPGTLTGGERHWHIGSSSPSADARLFGSNRGIADHFGVTFDNGTASSGAGVTLTSPAIGDRIQTATILDSDGGFRFVVSHNEGAASDNSDPGPAGGLPSSWAGNLIWLNSVDANAVNSGHYRQFKIVKQDNLDSALDGTENDELIAELAALTINQFGTLRAA